LLDGHALQPWRCWPNRKLDIFGLHRWTGYALLAVVILHPGRLLISTTRFRIVDLVFVYPVHSPSQPLENSIGAFALCCVVVVVVTSYFRLWLGRRLWKAFHFLIYAAVVALFWHSIFADPTLKHMPFDPFDGEKGSSRRAASWLWQSESCGGATPCANHPLEPYRSLRRREFRRRFSLCSDDDVVRGKASLWIETSVPV
jgi:hypothetical protein